MEFRHPDGRLVPVLLPGRSLLLMKGESRYLWSHGWAGLPAGVGFIGTWAVWSMNIISWFYFYFFGIRYRVQYYRLFATVLYSEWLMQILLLPFRITPRKFDTVPSDDPQSSISPTHLTLTKRGTRTSFTFRKIRHAPCRCGEILRTLTLSEFCPVHPASLYFHSFPHLFIPHTVSLSSLSLGLWQSESLRAVRPLTALLPFWRRPPGGGVCPSSVQRHCLPLQRHSPLAMATRLPLFELALARQLVGRCGLW